MRRQATKNRRVLLAVASLVLAGLALTASSSAQTLATPTLSIYAGSGLQGPPIPGAAKVSPLDLNFPSSGLAVDRAGNLYIADNSNNEVERVAPPGDQSHDAILSVVVGTGAAGAPTPGPATASTLNQPTAVAVDAAGDLFIADFFNHAVEKVTPAGQLSVVAGTGVAGMAIAGTAAASPLGFPVGVAVNQATGDLYIADAAASTGGNLVEKVTPAGILSIAAGTGDSGPPTPGQATASTLGDPAGIAVDHAGNFYVADSDDELVVKVTTGGVLSVVAGSGGQGTPAPGPATAAQLGNPAALAVDGAGSLYIADEFNSVVERVTAAGTLSIVAGIPGTNAAPQVGPAAASPLNGPVGLALDPTGNLYIADVGSNLVEKVTFTTTTTPPVVPPVTPPPPPPPPPPVVVAQPRPSVLIGSGPVTVTNGVLVRLPSTAPSGAKAVAAAQTPSRLGTWVITAEGAVFTTGDAGFYGSTAGVQLAEPIEGMAPTRDGKGYWLVASDGGIFTYGDAGFYGSLGGIHLNKPIVGMAATASGRGYWLFAADGGIFAFGDAGFFGSTGGVRLDKPINGMSSSGTGRGYWMVASDGGIFAFGDAGFYGSLGSTALSAPVQGMVTSDGGHGYWLVGNDGRVYDFGDAA
jgi:hypothetical protein